MQSYSLDDWRRLGTRIRSARKQAGLRDSKEWSSTVGRSTRVLLGLERGERVGDDTLELIEDVLQWRRGDAERVLAGTETTPATSTDRGLSVVPTTVDVLPPVEEDNEVLAAIRRDPSLSPDAKQHFLNQYALLAELSRHQAADEHLSHVAYDERTSFDPKLEEDIDADVRRAARENPDSPYSDK